MFHIEDPSGERQKRFHSVVASRFSCHKSNLRARFITFKNPYPATSPKANMKPWEVYEGYFTEEKWKRFEIYSKSAEFKVTTYSHALLINQTKTDCEEYDNV